MENPIAITMLNDFVFCPVSIYFHKLYDGMENVLFQEQYQLNGTKAHETVDKGTYTAPHTIMGVEVYSSQYNLIGRIDMYNHKTLTLTERKKHVNVRYDGYVFQLYAQYFGMTEMGYQVKHLKIHSMDDNKNYSIPLPSEDHEMFTKFKELIEKIQTFQIDDFEQTNPLKCKKCIYCTYCYKGASDVVSG